jgi:hypothetical protein
MWPERNRSASPAPDPEPIPDPGASIAGWRRKRLLRAGFDPELAAWVAFDCAFDLHAVIELVERGCPPALAVRILAPIEGERNPC